MRHNFQIVTATIIIGRCYNIINFTLTYLFHNYSLNFLLWTLKGNKWEKFSKKYSKLGRNRWQSNIFSKKTSKMLLLHLFFPQTLSLFVVCDSLFKLLYILILESISVNISSKQQLGKIEMVCNTPFNFE